jgi:hypothetical protein
MDEVEVRLAGNTSSVWRRGATVRRSTGPWTPAVHRYRRDLVFIESLREPLEQALTAGR